MSEDLMRVIREICEEAPSEQPGRGLAGNMYEDEDYGYACAQFEIAERLRPFLAPTPTEE